MKREKNKNVVLLGDSIFDNQPYVQPGQAVINKINLLSPSHFSVELLAVDGAVTADVQQQCQLVDDNTTHVVVSCGGNDALGYVPIFDQSVATVYDSMEYFAVIKKEFAVQYEEMLEHLASLKKNLVLCTIYNTCPNTPAPLLTALAVFNDVIFHKAFERGLPVLDLRIIFNSSSDYSSISPIEPSETGGEKLAAKIISTVSDHDFSKTHSCIYC